MVGVILDVRELQQHRVEQISLSFVFNSGAAESVVRLVTKLDFVIRQNKHKLYSLRTSEHRNPRKVHDFYFNFLVSEKNNPTMTCVLKQKDGVYDSCQNFGLTATYCSRINSVPETYVGVRVAYFLFNVVH